MYLFQGRLNIVSQGKKNAKSVEHYTIIMCGIGKKFSFFFESLITDNNDIIDFLRAVVRIMNVKYELNFIGVSYAVWEILLPSQLYKVIICVSNRYLMTMGM